MNLHRALSDLATIRSQLDRTASYRGFRSTATGVSSVFVVGGAIFQKHYFSPSTISIDTFLTIWLSVAVLSTVIAGVEMAIRGFRSRSRQVWRTHQKLVHNLLPSLIVGSILTLVIANRTIDQPSNIAWLPLLPGIWAMIFGLGLLNCRHELPVAAVWVAGYYLTTGIVCLLFDSRSIAILDWQMVILFGIGQALLGAVLFWNLERVTKTEPDNG